MDFLGRMIEQEFSLSSSDPIEFETPQPSDIDFQIQVFALEKRKFLVQVCNKQTRDQDCQYEVIRKLSDFQRLRDLLVLHWPGTWLPPFHHCSTQDTLTQRSLCELFLVRVTTTLGHLTSTDPVQTFLKSPLSYTEAVKNITEISYTDLSPAYFSAFGSDCSPVSQVKSQALDSYKRLFTQGLSHIQSFITMGKLSRQAFFSLRQNDSTLQTALKLYQNPLFEDSFPRDESILTHKNPYEKVIQWAKRERAEYLAMIEALDGRLKLMQKRAKCELKIAKNTQKLEELNEGKFDLTAFLHISSKGDLKSRKSIDLKQHTDRLASLERLLLCTSNRLLEVDIPQFQAKRLSNYREMMQLYASSLRHEASDMQSMVTCLYTSL